MFLVTAYPSAFFMFVCALVCLQHNYSAIDTDNTGRDQGTVAHRAPLAHGHEGRTLRREPKSSGSVDLDGYAIPLTNDGPAPRSVMVDRVYSVPSDIGRDGRTIVRDGR